MSFSFYKILGSTFPHESIVSKENTASAFGLEITGVKPKKTVTINDPAASRSRANEFRRTNSDSPELIIDGKIYLLSFRRINFIFSRSILFTNK